MNIIFEDKFDEIDTFEAFFKVFFLKGDRLLIPYINVGVSNHPLNPSEELLHLDFCYVICLDIALIKCNSEIILDNTLGKVGTYDFVYLGGTNLNENVNVEYQVLCRKAFIQILENTKMLASFWIPPRQNVISNMSSFQIESFFSLEDLPPNISQLFS